MNNKRSSNVKAATPGITQPTIKHCKHHQSRESSNVPIKPSHGENVIPAATSGIEATIANTESLKIHCGCFRVARTLPLIPAMIGAANPAKWKWTTVSRMIVSP